MESFQKPQYSIRTEVPEIKKRSPETDPISDQVFDQYMKQQLVEDFFEELDEYIEPEDVDRMRSVLSDYEDEEIYAALSLPKELRELRFEKFKKSLEEESETPEELIKELVEVSQKYGFGVGYHTSPNDIRPDKNGHWVIAGTEPDHRDGDRAMAYYSTQYRHLFKKKDPKFVYMVRTEPQTHRTDGNWSRASTLSVIMQVPFSEVFNYVEKTTHAIEKENGTAADADRPS